MFPNSVSGLSLILATLAAPAQAQVQSQDQPTPSYEAQPAPYAQPPYDERNPPGYSYGYSSRGNGDFEFDRGLLSAVNACANRAARWNLGRITINEIDRTTYGRFIVRGTTNRYGFYGEESNEYGYGHNYRPFRAPFTCIADIYGRVISWT